MNKLIPLLIFFTFTFAQPYFCRWQVIASGGGNMTGAYRCGSTISQTAVGKITISNLIAHIGFWIPEPQVGIREEEREIRFEPIRETKLYPPAPNPFSHKTTIRYTLAKEGKTIIEILDISGRRIRELLSTREKPGRYLITWDGRNNSGRKVASGIYLLRFITDDYWVNRKLILRQ